MQNSQGDKFDEAVHALDKLIQKQKPLTSTALKSYVVALFTADDNNPLRYSEKIGLLQLDIDRSLKTHFLRFYDIQTISLLLELELYYGFGENYRKYGRPTLYIFDFFADGVIGFEFRNKDEAEIMAMKIKSVSPKNESFKELRMEKIQKQIEEKKSNSFFGRMKKKFHNLVGEQQKVVQSEVIEVQKKKSITINYETGAFNLEQIPPQWQQIFDELNLSKEDLQKKQVVQLIVEETIRHQAKKIAEEHPEKVNAEVLCMIKEDNSEQSRSSVKSEVDTVDVESIQNLIPPPPPPPELPRQLEKRQVRQNSNENEGEKSNPVQRADLLAQIRNNKVKLNPINTLEKSGSSSQKSSSSRSDLMAEIRNSNLKLKPVQKTSTGVALDASSMNREERKDLCEHLRLKLQRRKLALNRRKSSHSSDSDSHNDD